MRNFKRNAGLDRLVVVWCASTEVFLTPGPAHQSLAAFEKAMAAETIKSIAPAMLYAYAALWRTCRLRTGAQPDGRPSVMERLARTATCRRGQGLQTGQTMMKSVTRTGVQGRNARPVGVVFHQHPRNRDGEVLDDPESFKTKESRSRLARAHFPADLYPELYGKVYHKVRSTIPTPRRQ